MRWVRPSLLCIFMACDDARGPLPVAEVEPDAALDADAALSVPRGAPDASIPEAEPPTRFDLAARVPPYFPELPPTPDNPLTEPGRALGERLFFDTRLSSNGRVSCASCHDPAHALTIPEARPTRGVSGLALVRNAPVLFNLAWATGGLFWDGGAKNLESLSLGPLTHPDEMAVDLDVLIAGLKGDPSYVRDFEAAFGPNGLSISALLRALAQYQRTLIAADAPWDAIVRGERVLMGDEVEGEALFARHCARCHVPGLFTDHGFHDVGLDDSFPKEPEAPARGRARVSLVPEDLGKYKTPTLRNLGRSAPYMHDGRFATLDDVLDHYTSGMRASPALDPGFVSDDGRRGVALSDDERRALRAFLALLDDAR